MTTTSGSLSSAIRCASSAPLAIATQRILPVALMAIARASANTVWSSTTMTFTALVRASSTAAVVVLSAATHQPFAN